MWNNRDSHSLQTGVQNGKATTQASLAVPFKTTHSLTIQTSKHTSWYLPKGVENVYPHKNLQVDVYSCFIHNCQNLDATKMFFSK